MYTSHLLVSCRKCESKCNHSVTDHAPIIACPSQDACLPACRSVWGQVHAMGIYS
jgi:hypothetical protein